MGHMIQAVGIVAAQGESAFCVPLSARIHDGMVWSNRDCRTLIDKYAVLNAQTGIEQPSYHVADAYYECGRLARGFVKELNWHLVTRAGRNAVAYELPVPPPPGKRGRKPKYGKKIKLSTLFEQKADDTIVTHVYGTKRTYKVWRRTYLWRSYGGRALYVATEDEDGHRIILMTTDTTLSNGDLIKLYALRMKIDVSFKPAVHELGTYAYHLWCLHYRKTKRGEKDRHMHKETEEVREKVRHKLKAIETHIQCGLIAQGSLQMLSLQHTDEVASKYDGYLRTIRPGVMPSEGMVKESVAVEYLEFLQTRHATSDLEKFIDERLRDRLQKRPNEEKRMAAG